jgi:hypothetical protein
MNGRLVPNRPVTPPFLEFEMNCPTCGKYLSKGDTYCTFCKKEVVVEPEVIVEPIVQQPVLVDKTSTADPQLSGNDASPEDPPLPAEETPVIMASLADEPSRSEDPPPPATGPKKEIFEAVYRSEAYQNRNSAERLATVPRVPQWQVAIAKGLPVIILILMLPILAVPLLMSLFVFFAGGIKFALCPLVFFFLFLAVVVSIYLAAKKSTSQTSTKKAGSQGPSIESIAAIIVGRRTVVSGGGDSFSVHQNYLITAEFENGERQEYTALDGNLMGKVVDGDAGIIFVQGSFLCDFDRVVL